MQSQSQYCCHCVDLVSKDVHELSAIVATLAEAKEVAAFVNINRVRAIKENAYANGIIDECVPTAATVETRMNVTYNTIAHAEKQMEFIVKAQTIEQFQIFYNERNHADKAKLDKVIENCSNDCRKRFIVVAALLRLIKDCHLICLSENTNISVYPLLLMAMKNQLSEAFGE